MNGPHHGLDRRPLILSAVAAAVLCGVWLLPSAYADADDDSGSGMLPVERAETLIEQDQ
jgi:hypothetical protein